MILDFWTKKCLCGCIELIIVYLICMGGTISTELKTGKVQLPSLFPLPPVLFLLQYQ